MRTLQVPQLDNVSGLAFGPDGHWAVVNTRGPGYIDLTYTTLGSTVVVINALPDNPTLSNPIPAPMHSQGNIDLSLDGETLLLNDTTDLSGPTFQSEVIVMQGIRPGGPPPRVAAIHTIAAPPEFPLGPNPIRDARLTLDGRYVVAPIPLIRAFDAQQLPIGLNQIAILGPIRNGTLDTARLLTEADGVHGGPYQAGVSPDGDSALVVNALDGGGANLLTGLGTGDPAKFKVSALPFPFFGPPFPLGPNGPPVLASHGQAIYTPDGDSALVVNWASPPLAGLPLIPSLSVLTGFQSGNIRVAANLRDPTFNPFDNRQQIATAPAGLMDYVNLYVRAGAARDGLAALLNDAITRADRGELAARSDATVDDLVNFIRSVYGLLRQGVINASQAATLSRLAVEGIQNVVADPTHNGSIVLTPGAVAPNSIASLNDTEGLFSPRLVTSTLRPLPTTLGGISVTVIDATGTERLAPLFSVSPGQIVYLVPQGTATGKAVVLVGGSRIMGAATSSIEPLSPGLITGGAMVQRVRADGTQSVEPVDLPNSPIDLGPETDQVYLILYGTGIRGHSGMSGVTATVGGEAAAVSYAGPQPDFDGLDQVNLLLPRSLIGRGRVEIALSIQSWDGNRVTISIR